jgi:hypothetical protein
MKVINRRTTDDGIKVNTYRDTSIADYSKEVSLQREIAIIGGYVDSQDHYRIGTKDIHLIKEIVDSRKESYDGNGLAREILLSGKYREYLAEWFKGRGSFYAHFPAVLKMIERIAPEVGKLTGYSLKRQGLAFELGREVA